MTSSITIRPASPGDLDDVYSIEKACFGGGEAYPRFFFRQALDAFGELFLVAVEDGKVTGYALGSLQAGETDAVFLALAVDENHRRRGVGSRLMDRLFAGMRERCARRVTLTVAPGNDAAIAAYHSAGFSETAREEHYFGKGESRVVMIKEL
ncbi:MAG: GNAT family N-acetyltransferase [Candidatus Latescibacteria bacterium]|nr:GNAT family N-acetyltransferase [Candidatus Latescibacterota bacterium]